jgi:RNA polymerase sigma-70 factor (ECF subfamily)
MRILSSRDVSKLLTTARTGDRTALGALLQAYRPLLLVLARERLPRSLRPKVGASDMVQDVCVEACRDFASFSGLTDEEFRHWLIGIMGHNLADTSRHYLEARKRTLSREQSLENSWGPEVARALVAPDEPPPVEALRHEQRDALEHSLAELSDDDRRILEQHHRDRMPFEQIAQLLGRSEAAVRQQCHRAMQRWQHRVEAEYGLP